MEKNNYDQSQLDRLSQMFSVIGDLSRLKIVAFLLSGEANVGEIVEEVSLTQSAVSHQLKVLRDHAIVEAQKKGKMVYYRLNDDHVKMIVELGLVHMGHADVN